MSWGFINPPGMATWGDFTDNVNYVEGSDLNIVWQTPSDVANTLALYQANLTDGNVIGGFEFITQSTVNLTQKTWRVDTAKNLTLSNVFMMSLYEEGQGEVMGTSQYFNISSKSTTTTTTTSSSTTSSTASSSTISSGNTSAVPSSSASASASATPAPVTGLTTGAKIGIGVAIPGAVILGAAAAWFFFNRRRKHQGLADNYGGDAANNNRNTMTSLGGHPSMYSTSQYGPGQVKPGLELEGNNASEMSGENRMVSPGHYYAPVAPEQHHYEMYAPGPVPEHRS